MNTADLLPIGTKIEFTKSLFGSANDDHPDIVFAYKGETGVILGHDTCEGYRVKADNCEASFGAARSEFAPLV